MQGKKPTKRQAIFLQEHKLNSQNWLICKDMPAEMVIQHRESGNKRLLKKYKGGTSDDGIY